jgi:integrase
LIALPFAAKNRWRAIPAERIVTVADFVERVYLPWVQQHKRPSTAKGYRDIWEDHLKPLCGKLWLRETRTFHVQNWLNAIGSGSLARNTLKHVKSVVSGVFTLAKQLGYFDGVNPVQDTRVNPAAAEPQETYAYDLEEINAILAQLSEPAATVFAVASFMGLRHGELQGLLWEDYHDGELYVSRSIWNGHVGEPKTRKSKAGIPVIRHLADRLELHRLCSGNPPDGPIFRNTLGKPLDLHNVVNRAIVPALNRCATCLKPQTAHLGANHDYVRDGSLPEWHGWHAARRGLGSNLHRLGVPDLTIQRILRHSNVAITQAYYIKTADADVQAAMAMLESRISEPEKSPVDSLGTVVAQKNSNSTTVQ